MIKFSNQNYLKILMKLIPKINQFLWMLMLEIGDKNYIFKLVLSLMNLIFMIQYILVKNHQMMVMSHRIKIKN